MKKFITLCLIAFSVLALNSSLVRAQIVEEQFSLSELDPYVSEYMKPFANAMAVSMSGGWTHTAKVHSTLGFDLTFSVSAAKVPSSDRNFNPQSIADDKYSFTGNSTPTISGDKDDATTSITRNFSTPGAPNLTFDGFNGQNISYGGMFAIQGAIGLPKGTELILRFIPDISKSTNNLIPGDEFGLEKTGMWGVGVKHDIKQWIPVVSKVPFLQISALLTYSKFHTGFSGDAFRIAPEDFDAASSLPTTTWDNQRFDIAMSSFTGNLLIGANIPVFQPYIGVGYNTAKFDGGLVGDYPVIDLVADVGEFEYQVNESESDPIMAEAKVTNFNFQAGARLKLGPIVFHYTFTQQKYSMHTGGIAVTLR